MPTVRMRGKIKGAKVDGVCADGAGLRGALRAFCKQRHRCRSQADGVQEKSLKKAQMHPPANYDALESEMAPLKESTSNELEQSRGRSGNGPSRPNVTSAWPEDLAQLQYTAGGCRLTVVANGDQSSVAILPSQSTAEMLQKAVLEDRHLRQAEEHAGEELGVLTEAVDHVRMEIEEVEDALDEAMQRIDVEASAEIDELNTKLDRLRQKEASIVEKQKSCNQTLEAGYSSQRHSVHLLLSEFEQVLLAGRMIKPEDAGDHGASMNGGGASAVSILSIERGRGFISATASQTESIKAHSHPLRRRSAITDLQAASDDGVPEEERAANAERDHLIGEFQSQQARLRVMEAAFEEREDRFEKEAAEREEKIKAGEEVESTLAFDHGQLHTTRRLARQFIEAEEAVEAAKAAAVAAGVQVPGSDIDSGFVDDVGDGYLISSEDEYANTVDRKRIEAWLGLVPECDTDDISEVDIDDWDTRSAGMSDSLSMVADGAERRRIDKWRAVCEGRAAEAQHVAS
ncbi:hypothetical protein LTR15_004506 [Elasticomyces elasticus]|nr:hypothetical protein LTR15_004506 [Elasticomyces elasticus]